MLWAAGMTGLSDGQAPWLTVSLRISRTTLEFSIFPFADCSACFGHYASAVVNFGVLSTLCNPASVTVFSAITSKDGGFFKQLILPQHFGTRYAILMSFLYSICIVFLVFLIGIWMVWRVCCFFCFCFFWYTHEMRFKVSYANALAKSTAILAIRDNTLGSWSHLEHLLTAGFPLSKQESQSMSVANI